MNLAKVAWHEARHIAFAAAVNIGVHYAAIHPDGTGITKRTIGDLDRDRARRLVKVVMASYLDEPDWPPPFPPRADAERRDEQQLHTLTEYLGLTQQDWNTLVAETWELAQDPTVRLHEYAAASMLLRLGATDKRALQAVHDIVTEVGQGPT